MGGDEQFVVFLVGTECVHTLVVHARVDVVATKLGIILFFFLSSTYFSQLLCGHGVRALWVSEHPPRSTHNGTVPMLSRSGS